MKNGFSGLSITWLKTGQNLDGMLLKKYFFSGFWPIPTRLLTIQNCCNSFRIIVFGRLLTKMGDSTAT